MATWEHVPKNPSPAAAPPVVLPPVPTLPESPPLTFAPMHVPAAAQSHENAHLDSQSMTDTFTNSFWGPRDVADHGDSIMRRWSRSWAE